MLCYLINLDRAADRLAAFDRQARALGIALRRIRAVDARDLSAGVGRLTRAELACFLSHRLAWRAVLEGQEEWAFIAEDDLCFSAAAARFLADAAWIPPMAQLIKAETTFSPLLRGFSPIARAHGHRVEELWSWHWGCAGYFLSRRGAERLLALGEVPAAPVDQLVFQPGPERYHDMPLLQLVPAICAQEMVLAARRGRAPSLPSLIDQDEPREVPGLAAATPPAITPARLWQELRGRLHRARLYLRREAILGPVPLAPLLRLPEAEAAA